MATAPLTLSQGQPREAPDECYLREAIAMLDDEFVWFSAESIRQVFATCRQSWSATWHALNASEEDGRLAAIPVPFLYDARVSKVVVAGRRCPAESLKSCRLNDEVVDVERTYKRLHSEFKAWADGLFFSSDLHGEEQLLSADGEQVMMQWEKPYMIKCVEALQIGPDTDILEIGFGCAYSADEIQRYKPRSHTIIECAGEVLKRLRVWAQDKPGVVVVEGTWQETLPSLGTFDCVFFDDYGTPGRSDREMEEYCPDPRYREEYVRSVRADKGTHFHAFINIILQWHSHEGTRISGYLEHPVEMQRDDVEATYHSIPITASPLCDYWPGIADTATVPLFLKLQPSDASTETGSIPNDGVDSLSESRSCSRSRSRSPRRALVLADASEQPL